MDPKQYWEQIYQHKAADEVSWYQVQPERSLRMIEHCGIALDAAILDVGCGASTLVDHLLAHGYTDVTVLDISSAALHAAQTRLRADARRVHWVESAVGEFQPNRPFDLWHDRAVFHFLTASEDRRRYVEVLHKALHPSGHLIMATFAKGGPRQCSGLDIVQYDASALSAEIGQGFELLEQNHEIHRTPAGVEQDFAYFRFRKR